jgi:hypothetical protein
MTLKNTPIETYWKYEKWGVVFMSFLILALIWNLVFTFYYAQDDDYWKMALHMVAYAIVLLSAILTRNTLVSKVKREIVADERQAARVELERELWYG